MNHIDSIYIHWIHELMKHMQVVCYSLPNWINSFVLCNCGKIQILSKMRMLFLETFGWRLIGIDLCASDNDWSTCGREDHRWLPSASVLRGFHKEAHQPDQKDLLRPAPAGPSDSQEDDGDHDPWGSDQRPEGSCQQAVSSHEFLQFIAVNPNIFIQIFRWSCSVNCKYQSISSLNCWLHGKASGYLLSLVCVFSVRNHNNSCPASILSSLD